MHPEDFGLPMASNRALRVDTPEQSLAVLRGVLDNQPGAARDIVMLNAGAAKAKLAQFVAFSQMAARDVARRGRLGRPGCLVNVCHRRRGHAPRLCSNFENWRPSARSGKAS